MGNIISYFFPQPSPTSIEDASQNNVAASGSVSAVPQYVVENQKSELIYEDEKNKAADSIDEGLEVIEDNESIVVEENRVLSSEKALTPEPIKLATPEPEKALAPEPIKLATPEPEKALTPEPVKLATPEPEKALTLDPVKLATPEPEKALTPEPVKLATPEPEKTLTPDPVKLATPEPEPVKLDTIEPEKALTPEPGKFVIPESEKALTTEPVKLDKPEAVKDGTPEPAKVAAAEPENALTSESMKLATPEPEKVLAPEAVKLEKPELEKDLTPEPVKLPTPEPEKSVTPEPVKLLTPEPDDIDITPETVTPETGNDTMPDDGKHSNSQDTKVHIQEFVEDLIPEGQETKTLILGKPLSPDTPNAKTPEPVTDSIKIGGAESKPDIYEDDVEVIEFQEDNKNILMQEGAGGAAGVKDLLN